MFSVQKIKEWEWYKPSVLLAVFALLVLLDFSLVSRNNYNNFHLRLDFSSKTIQVGDTFNLAIYAEGKNASDLSAAQISLDYDTKKLLLVNASAGGFFKNGLVVNLDEAKSSFSFTANPGEVSKGSWVDSSKPLVVLTFKADSPSFFSKILTNKFSLVYFYKRGGYYPQIVGGYVKLNSK